MPKLLSSSCQKTGLYSRDCPSWVRSPAGTWSIQVTDSRRATFTGEAEMLQPRSIFLFLISIPRYPEQSNPSVRSGEGPPHDAKCVAEHKGWNLLASWIWHHFTTSVFRSTQKPRESVSHSRDRCLQDTGSSSDLWDLQVSFLKQADPLLQTAHFCLELQIHLL